MPNRSIDNLFDHSLPGTRLAPPAALDGSRSEPHPLELEHLGSDLARCHGQPALSVAGAAGLAIRGPLVPVGAYEVVGLFQQRVQGVFHRSSHELPELAAHGFLVECRDGADMALPPG